MSVTLEGKLVIGISSRALFDLAASNKIFEEKGEEEYTKYQIDHENELLVMIIWKKLESLLMAMLLSLVMKLSKYIKTGIN